MAKVLLNLTTLLAIYDKNDNLLQRFEYANDRIPVAMTDANGTKYYLHYDQVGSLRAVSNENSNIVKEIVYDTFGNIISDSNETLKIPFGFAGGLQDRDTKLIHFGFREYDPFIGRWTAKDPILFAGGDSNLYGYVLGDPVDGIDPEGLVDLNLFKPKTELYYTVWQYGLFFKGYTIAAHGSPILNLSGKGPREPNVIELEILMRNNGYRGGAVTLLSCNTGRGGKKSYAQKLANHLGVVVYAPTSIFYFGALGFWSTSDGKGLTAFYPQWLGL